jgi:hypothetical protein
MRINSLYLEAERQLAELLSWRDIRLNKLENGWEGYLVNNQVLSRVPSWTKDDAAAFALMLRYRISLDITEHIVFASATDQEKVIINYSIHPDESTAVRYAIVSAVIKKLEGKFKLN